MPKPGSVLYPRPMRKLLLCLFTLTLASAVRANPMLEKCLTFAPAVCGLNDKSTQEEFLSCFEPVHLNAKKSAEASCAEELAHARVHKTCDADLPKFCAAVKPGANRTMSCLRKNSKNLSEGCRKALKDYDAIAVPQLDGDSKKDGKRSRRTSGVAATRC